MANVSYTPNLTGEKRTISTLIDQTFIQLTHQRRKNPSFFKTNFSVIQTQMHYDTGIFARKWRQVWQLYKFVLVQILPLLLQLRAITAHGAIFKCSSGWEKPRKVGGNVLLKTIWKCGRQTSHRLQKICWYSLDVGANWAVIVGSLLARNTVCHACSHVVSAKVWSE